MEKDAMADDGQRHLDLLADVIAMARAAGADAADAVMFDSISLSVSHRLGQLEDIERSESSDLGLRAIIGHRQAMVSTTDSSPTALREVVERAMAMARAAPEDPYCGLLDAEALIKGDPPALDLYDPVEPASSLLIERALAAEDAARAVSGVTNSEGAGAGWGRGRVAIASSHGLARCYAGTNHSLSVQVIAGEGADMQADYDYCAVRHGENLDDPTDLGQTAGTRAVRALNPRKVETCRVPVVYAPRVASSLLGHLAGAINGQAIARGSSFLKDCMGEQLFAPGVVVSDDPLRRRGLRSKPLDGEGAPTRRLDIVEDGRLASWLLDGATARQLGLATTGHASRGTSAPPSPSATNLFMAPGAVSPDELIGDIKSGLYVTGLIGMGVNMVTGDYSKGANGFWIDNGEITFAVSELTIAGNLRDMFRSLVAADDLIFRHGVNAPTLRIDGMTVAGG